MESYLGLESTRWNKNDRTFAVCASTNVVNAKGDRPRKLPRFSLAVEAEMRFIQHRIGIPSKG